QKVAKQVFAHGSHDGLGVELDPFNRVRTVPQTHNQSVRRLGGNLQFIRECGTLDNEAVITVSFKGDGEMLKYSLPLVIHQCCFPMHGYWCAYNVSAVNLSNCLVSQADPQGGDACPECGNDLARKSGFIGGAWTR